MSAKAFRRYERDLRKIAEACASRGQDRGNLFPINAGGLPAHLTDQARRDAALGACLLVALEPGRGGR